MTRLSWERYFLGIAEQVATRSTCIRHKVGAVIVKENRILSTGYNGPPAGFAHCEELGRCAKDCADAASGTGHEKCMGVHAEQNAIVLAAYHGVAIAGASIYCTIQPCSICARMLINAGIRAVHYKDLYVDAGAIDALIAGDVDIQKCEE